MAADYGIVSRYGYLVNVVLVTRYCTFSISVSESVHNSVLRIIGGNNLLGTSHNLSSSRRSQSLEFSAVM